MNGFHSQTLMAVLMVMFLFIAVIYFKRADVEILREEKVKIESEKTKLNNMKSSLEADLEKHKDDISALELKKREVENLLDQAKISLEEKTLLVNSAKKRAANERQKILNIELNLKKTLENQRIVITNFQSFQLVQNEIFEALKEEFENDLTRWQAELTKDDLAIRFFAPDVLFEAGKSALKLEFKKILIDFMPRYVRVLRDFGSSISEIRIEGHTSSERRDANNELDRYLLNLELSQNRAREVAKFSLKNLNSSDEKWVRKSLTSNGLSSSKLVLDENLIESKEKSRRVEFKVITDVSSTLRALNDLTTKHEN
jgi:outer membrane protein OmpA-like peptidoglycan-associated protein